MVERKSRRHRWNLPTLFQEGAIPTICMCVIEPVLECRIQNVLNIVVWVATHSRVLYHPVFSRVGLSWSCKKNRKAGKAAKELENSNSPCTANGAKASPARGDPRRAETTKDAVFVRVILRLRYPPVTNSCL